MSRGTRIRASPSADLGEHLQPYAGAAVPAVDVTGVHGSKLTDPTPFPDGGELLLTTGMPLTGHTISARAYVARLTHRGLRHRIGTAAKVLAVDLDDPDVAARLWLALRGEGLA